MFAPSSRRAASFSLLQRFPAVRMNSTRLTLAIMLLTFLLFIYDNCMRQGDEYCPLCISDSKFTFERSNYVFCLLPLARSKQFGYDGHFLCLRLDDVRSQIKGSN